MLIPLAQGAAWLSVAATSMILAERKSDNRSLHGYVFVQKKKSQHDRAMGVMRLGQVTTIIGTFADGVPHGSLSFRVDEEEQWVSSVWDQGRNKSAKMWWAVASFQVLKYSGRISFDGTWLHMVGGKICAVNLGHGATDRGIRRVIVDYDKGDKGSPSELRKWLSERPAEQRVPA